MKYALLLTAVHDQHTPAKQQVDEHRRLVSAASELGFDTLIAGQHFLSPSLRYYQPIPYLAHMATLAPSMRVATGILLLPLLHPVDVAEQVATLDALTDGRAIVGVGIGYADKEFEAFGVDRRTRARRLEESLEIMRAIWAGRPVRHEGEFWSLDLPATAVLPVQEGGPQVWIAGQTEKAVRRAARLADAWYAPPFPTHRELVELRRAFLEERAARGTAPEREFAVRRELFIAPSQAAALYAIGRQIEARFGTYLQWGMRENADVAGGFAVATEDALTERFIIGPPEVCAQRLCELAELGTTMFVLKVQWPGLDADASLRQLEEFGTEVIPRVAAALGG